MYLQCEDGGVPRNKVMMDKVRQLVMEAALVVGGRGGGRCAVRRGLQR
jgi:hypothetical protein